MLSSSDVNLRVKDKIGSGFHSLLGECLQRGKNHSKNVDKDTCKEYNTNNVSNWSNSPRPDPPWFDHRQSMTFKADSTQQTQHGHVLFVPGIIQIINKYLIKEAS